jgi:ferric-dicitrate binding protein FerR (iron transport regulator)
MEKEINQIIARALSGEASPDDILLLSRWLNEQDENEKTFVRLKSYWAAEVAGNDAVDSQLVLEKIRKRIAAQEAHRVRRTFRRIFIPAAAAVAVAILVFTFNLFYAGTRNAAHDAHNYYTHLTNNQRSLFTLDDGTKITLNKNSRLTWSDGYGKTDRRVKIDGEAFFEVTHNAELPFEVAFEMDTDDDVSIKVLGTTFNVKADEAAEKIIATLVEGSIRFDAQGREIILTPEQQLEFACAEMKIDVRYIDIETETAWKDGLLKYKAVSFAKLVEELGRIHGAEIHITNKKLMHPSVTVSGTFEESQSLEQIFTVISKSLPFRWTKKDGKYYIR